VENPILEEADQNLTSIEMVRSFGVGGFGTLQSPGMAGMDMELSHNKVFKG
jgi:hypothetical protein